MTLFDPEPPAPPEPRARVRLLVSYDGASYHGFAPNPGVRTVAGTLSDALEKVLGHAIELTGAGRTDRGVHAYGQVVSFDTHADRFDPVGLQRSLNKLLRPAIAIRSVERVADDFNARFSATGRVYRYSILNSPVHDPFRSRFAWHVSQPLNLAAMRQGAIGLVGAHDFSSFCRRPPTASDGYEPTLARRVLATSWRDLGDDLLQFEISANAFCHQMVRAITGTLVDVGLGRRHAAEILQILAARDRSVAGRVAPPEGLTLWEVKYDDRPPG